MSAGLYAETRCQWVFALGPDVSWSLRSRRLLAGVDIFLLRRESVAPLSGDVAQLVRAHGSYPWCRRFKSYHRHPKRLDLDGRAVCFSGLCGTRMASAKGQLLEEASCHAE